MQTVTYFKMDGAPGDYFTCGRYGTMSVGACGRNFTAAPKEARQRGRLEGCIGCATGACHASGAVITQAQETAAVIAPAKPLTYVQTSHMTVCVRCRRGGSADTESRLIGRMRLVRAHTLCLSCYNREREVIHGRNAKGARPKKWKGLFTIWVTYGTATAVRRERFAQPVNDHLEAALTVLRRDDRPAFIGWTPSAACLEMQG